MCLCIFHRHFKYLENVLTRDGYSAREIKMRIVIAKEVFNTKISLFRSKLNIELRKKLARSYVWSIALYGSETWTLGKLERKYLESFEVWCWRTIRKIKFSGKITNERVGEKRTILNNVLRKVWPNWVGHILKRDLWIIPGIFWLKNRELKFYSNKKKLNLWLTAPKGDIPVN